ncbi:MAG: histidinol-phosphatase HisJ family protein [Ruminococcus sp.]|nr:histidinol-phosphatase HisJ family protein [Ruminococcus sp.]MCM1382301.1 histidinol-phosphatase HisJ family protein [Muribaculaceae bacterium]MCM1480424.1 histidinol-phosphatase HisJ family protein [Muribaculaceae bacterium]
MNLIDCHTHTQFSVDSEADITEMIEKAVSLGLAAYAVTDHCECNRWYSAEHYPDEDTYRYYDFGRDFENSVSAVTELKEKYGGKLNLICGVEMGQATHDYGIAEKIVSDSRVDFVIGSMHQLPKTEDFAFMDYGKMSPKDIADLAERYFLEINKLCKWGKFDVLGHLTYILRYMEGEGGVKVDMSPYEEIIRDSFKLLIQNGKGIEINTSGLRQKYGDVFPSLYWVKIFKEMGGEVLSLGSDAHTAEDLGKGIAEGAEIAKAAGFEYLCYFKERKPNFIKI